MNTTWPRLLFILAVLVANTSAAQVLRTIDRPNDNPNPQDSLRTNKRGSSDTDKKVAKIEDYLIISSQSDTTRVDTTLSINKYYKYNYLRKDNFNLLAFPNIGQTYNSLSYNFTSNTIKPKFGARARHFNYLEIEDIYYYHVPTPLTELFYKSAFEQGQLLDSYFTINLSQGLNLMMGYKGLRSLGKYQRSLASTGNFKFAINFTTKNERYNIKTHVVTQDLLNEENGGLSDEDIDNFRTGDDEFSDRSVFDPNFDDAESILVGKRFYADQYYHLIKKQDSLQKNTFKVGNIIAFEDKYYRYIQGSSDTNFFGEALSSSIRDRVTLEDFKIGAYLDYHSELLGNIRFNVDYNDVNYGYNNLVSLNNQLITNRIKSTFLAVGGNYRKRIGGFNVEGNFNTNLSNEFKGYNIGANASFALSDENIVGGTLNINNRRPNYNYLLYQSDYINYNWDNSSNFDNQTDQSLALSLNSNNLVNIEANYTIIDNYTFFGLNEENRVKPIQADEKVNYFRIKLNREFKFGNFALDNTLMYQSVLQGSSVLKVPEVITRNTFYYQNHLFKRALFLQTGISLNYFTEYNMNSYDPLLAEFYVQNTSTLGNFPRLDFFVNAKVRQTRIFIIAEHFNSSFTGYNYFSSPSQPYRDFAVRFGLVWNFFL